MRAILINPQDRTISEVEYTGDYRNIYQHIDAESFDCVRMGDREGHTFYVDDEGLINGAANCVGMFRVAGENPAYLAGKGLILATDRNGESVAASLSLDAVRSMVDFGLPTRFAGRVLFIGEKGVYPVNN